MDLFEYVLVHPIRHLDEFREDFNSYLCAWQPIQVAGAAIVCTLILMWIYNRTLARDIDLFKSIKESFFSFIKSLPIIGRKIREEVEATKSKISKEMFPLKKGHVYRTTLPEKGMDAKDIVDLVRRDYKGLETTNWQDGRVSGAVYYGGQEHDAFMAEIFKMFVSANLLQPDVFPGPRKMEAEIVAMCCKIFHGNENSCGVVTTCGSESLMLACKAYRELAAKRGITKPEILMPESGHAAFEKGARYFKMKMVRVPLDKKTFKVNMRLMKKMINKNTCMLVGSAPSFPHGAIDPIEDIAKLGKKYGIPVHVDMCMGGFVLPFLNEGKYDIPLCDFRVDGITSISADTHKYGLAPKGTSVLMYSNESYREGQYFILTEWSGGVYASSTMAGSRSGGIMATCWAAMMHTGYEGYRKNAEKVMEQKNFVENEIKKLPGICIYGQPKASIVSFGSDKFDIYRLAEYLTEKGWHLFILQDPPGVNLCVTPLFALSNGSHDFVQDVKNGVNQILKTPNAKSEGMAAIYGMAAKVPDRSLVQDFVSGYLDAYYHTKA